MQLIEALRHHFPQYNDQDFEVKDYVGLEGDLVGVLLYAGLFCPPLKEIDGMVLQQIQPRFFGEEYIARLRQHLEKVGGDRKEVEREWNFLEVWYDLFDPPINDRDRELTEEELDLIAEILAESWRAWLHWRYPSRRFVVEVVPAEVTGDVVGITFYEERQAGGGSAASGFLTP